MILAGAWLYTKRQQPFEFIGCMVATIAFIFLGMRRKYTIYEVKKEAFCGKGKRVLLYFLIMCGILQIMSLPVLAETGRKQEKLEVTIYDKKGRKLLLQNDTVWQVSEDIFLAIPLEVLEETEGVITVSYEIGNSGMVKEYQFPCCRK